MNKFKFNKHNFEKTTILIKKKSHQYNMNQTDPHQDDYTFYNQIKQNHILM